MKKALLFCIILGFISCNKPQTQTLNSESQLRGQITSLKAQNMQLQRKIRLLQIRIKKYEQEAEKAHKRTGCSEKGKQ